MDLQRIHDHRYSFSSDGSENARPDIFYATAAKLTYVIEWAIRVFILCLACFQIYLVLFTDETCYSFPDLLKIESTWLLSLAFS
jgi:hypothetical protein